MSAHFGDLAQRYGATGEITPEDILALRRDVWPDGRISQDEAEAIFALNHRITRPDAPWVDFFVEAIGEYVLHQREPVGYMDEENAAWLIQQIDADGQLGTMAELELLVRIFERATNVPQRLKTYTLTQIERAVIDGSGPTRDGGALTPGTVNATEARMLRRVIFAPASERPAAVGPHEAAMLFRLKDAALHGANAPEWKQLFVQGVANYLCGYSSANAQIDLARAADLEAFVANSRSSVSGFLRRMLRGASVHEGLADVRDGATEEVPSRSAQVAEAAQLTGEERRWLDGEINADGAIDEYEQALLAFLAEG